MNAPLPNEDPAMNARSAPGAGGHAGGPAGTLRRALLDRQAVCEQHGRDESPFPVTPPEVVVFCESTADVAFVVRWPTSMPCR
jgi:D-lactate dehydrogenase (cytochrome)